MFQKIPVNDEHIIAYKISGKLSHQDYQQFLPEIEALLKDGSPLSLFIELDNFKGWDLQAAWDDFKFDLSHGNELERIAIIGNTAWQKWMTLLSQPFISSEIKYFSQDQLLAAWDWLRQEDKKQADDNHPAPYQHILLPTDFSPHSFYIAERAKELCELYTSKLSVIHVYEPLMLFTDYYDTVQLDLYAEDQQLLDVSQQRLNDFMQKLDVKNSTSELIQGSSSSSILSYAEAQKIDLIIMGKHGYKGIDRLLGSTASAVINKARCEVLAIPIT